MEDSIRKQVDIIITSAVGNSVTDLNKVRDSVDKLIAKNPELAKNTGELGRAVQKLAADYASGMRKAADETEKSAKKQVTALNLVGKSFSSLEGLINKAGVSLSFSGALASAVSFNNQLSGLSVSMKKYGVSTSETINFVKRLSDESGLAQQEIAEFAKTFEKGFNFVSLQNATSLLKNIQNVVGADTNAIKQMTSELSAFAQQFPDLEQSVTRLNTQDKVRISGMNQLLAITGKVNMSQYKATQDYIAGNQNMSEEEKKRLKQLQESEKAIQQIKKTFSDLAISIGNTLMPILTKLGDIFKSYPGMIKGALGVIAGGVAIKGINASTGGMLTRATGALASSLFKGKGKGKGIAGALAGAMSGESGGFGGMAGIQKVFVVGGVLDRIQGNSAATGDLFEFAKEKMLGKVTPPPIPGAAAAEGAAGAKGLGSMLGKIAGPLTAIFSASQAVGNFKKGETGKGILNSAAAVAGAAAIVFPPAAIISGALAIGAQLYDPIKKMTLSLLHGVTESLAYLRKNFSKIMGSIADFIKAGMAKIWEGIKFALNPVAQAKAAWAGVKAVGGFIKDAWNGNLGIGDAVYAGDIAKEKERQAAMDEERKRIKAGQDAAREKSSLAAVAYGAQSSLTSGGPGAVANVLKDKAEAEATLAAMDAKKFKVAGKESTYSELKERQAEIEKQFSSSGDFTDEAKKALGTAGDTEEKLAQIKQKREQQLNDIKAKTTEIEKTRNPIQAKQLALQNAIVAAANLYRDKIAAANELLSAQNGLMQSIVSQMGALGPMTAKGVEELNKQLDKSLDTMMKQSEASSRLLLIEKTQASQIEATNKKEIANIDRKLASGDGDRNELLQKRLDLENGMQAAFMKADAAATQFEATQRQLTEQYAAQAVLVGKVNEAEVKRRESYGQKISSISEVSQLRGNIPGAAGAQSEVAANLRAEITLRDQEIQQIERRKIAEMEAMKTANPERRKIIQGAILELEKSQNEKIAERNRMYIQETEALTKIVEVGARRLGQVQSATGRMEAELELISAMGTGLSASAEQRMAISKQMENEIAVNKSVLSEIDKEIAKQNELATSANATSEAKKDALAQIAVLEAESNKKNTEILQTQIKQANMTKAIRDGYVSAIGAMMAGSGMITKITIDQNKNMGIGIKNLGMLQSFTSGGIGGGARRAGRFGAGGGLQEDPNRESQLYDTYNQAGMGTGGDISELHRRLKKSIRGVTSGAAMAAGDNAAATSAAIAAGISDPLRSKTVGSSLPSNALRPEMNVSEDILKKQHDTQKDMLSALQSLVGLMGARPNVSYDNSGRLGTNGSFGSNA